MTPAPEKAAPIPAEERLWWFLFVLNACGKHGAAANDEPGEWTAAFCSDEEPADTFNRACDLKLATCAHDSLYDTSRVWITEEGQRFLVDRASQEERIREDEREALALTDGELPDLPHPGFDGAFSAIQMRWYARTAVMADRARLRGAAS